MNKNFILLILLAGITFGAKAQSMRMLLAEGFTIRPVARALRKILLSTRCCITIWTRSLLSNTI